MARTLLFNPDNDLALANGDTNYIPPFSARRMAADLSLLPAWYAEAGDTVVVAFPGKAASFLHGLPCTELLPEVVLIGEEGPLPAQSVAPWGWNPALVSRLRKRGLPASFLPTDEEMACRRKLSGRAFAAGLLSSLRETLCDEPLTGRSTECHTEEEIACQLRLNHASLLKAPWSSSGKGLRRGDEMYAAPLSGWCRNTLRQQGAVMVEPLYRRERDFAMEFHSPGAGEAVRFVGYSDFVTDANGVYKGNRLSADKLIAEELARYVGPQPLDRVREHIAAWLTRHVAPHYEGFLGIDMMICRDDNNGEYRLHPCVELNLRMNMGLVAHTLHQRILGHETEGIFHITFCQRPGEMAERLQQMQAQHPLILSPEGRIVRGCLCLTPVGEETQYAAWLLAGEEELF